MLIVILEWRGGAIGFAKWKYCTGSISLTVRACFPRQRPNYWHRGGEGGWRAEVGMRRGRKLEATPLLWTQASHWSQEPPAVAVTWQASGLTSDQPHCCPDPSGQSSIQALRTPLHGKRHRLQLPGLALPRVPSDKSRPWKEGLASLSGVWIPRKPQKPGSAGIPSPSNTVMAASWWILTWDNPAKRPLASQNPKCKEKTEVEIHQV